jgi:hypothetical protein
LNIFVLNENPILAARDHCNKHVVKMILESAQMLSTAHWIGWQRMLKIDPDLKSKELMERLSLEVDPRLLPPWKMTHVDHPCTQWTQRCWGNYMWLSQHGMELCREYEDRYGKTHKSFEIHRWLNRVIPPTFETTAEKVTGITPFAIAMPEKYRVQGDAVQSYRGYYLGEKSRFAKWPAGKVPTWWSSTSYLASGGRNDAQLKIKAEDEGTDREGES